MQGGTLLSMPTTPLPPGIVKVSYLLPVADKQRLEAAAKKSKRSMSAVISDALAAAGILRPRKAA